MYYRYIQYIASVSGNTTCSFFAMLYPPFCISSSSFDVSTYLVCFEISCYLASCCMRLAARQANQLRRLQYYSIKLYNSTVYLYGHILLAALYSTLYICCYRLFTLGYASLLAYLCINVLFTLVSSILISPESCSSTRWRPPRGHTCIQPLRIAFRRCRFAFVALAVSYYICFLSAVFDFLLLLPVFIHFSMTCFAFDLIIFSIIYTPLPFSLYNICASSLLFIASCYWWCFISTDARCVPLCLFSFYSLWKQPYSLQLPRRLQKPSSQWSSLFLFLLLYTLAVCLFSLFLYFHFSCEAFSLALSLLVRSECCWCVSRAAPVASSACSCSLRAWNSCSTCNSIQRGPLKVPSAKNAPS